MPMTRGVPSHAPALAPRSALGKMFRSGRLAVMASALAATSLAASSGGGWGTAIACAADEAKPKEAVAPKTTLTQQEIQYASMPDVQQELGMTQEQTTALSDLFRQHSDLLAQRRQIGGTKEEYLAQMAAHQVEYEAKVASMLGEKQSKRLVQIVMQLEGHRLLARPRLQKTLEVSDDQAKRMTEILSWRQEEQSKDFRVLRNLPGNDPKARQEAITRQISFDEKAEKQMLEVLTAEQRKKLEGMLGPQVSFRKQHLERQHLMSN